MSTTTQKTKITSTKPTDMDALAALLVRQLRNYLLAEVQQTKTHIGLVADVVAGSPNTLTVSIHGEDVENIRYIGSAPSVGDAVVVQEHDGSYIALGALTP